MNRFAYLLPIALGLLPPLVVAEARLAGPAEYGVFEHSHRDPQPGERVLISGEPRLHSTDQVPARLGTRFGLRLRLENKRADDTPLTLLYLTPGVVDPAGQRHDRYEVVQKLSPGAAAEVMAFEFSEPYEVVPGEWHFLVFQGNRKLAEQRFQVR